MINGIIKVIKTQLASLRNGDWSSFMNTKDQKSLISIFTYQLWAEFYYAS